MSLSKLLTGLTGDPDPRTAPEQKPGAGRPKPGFTLFPAVSVVPGKPCCGSAQAASKKRVLAREAPPLPLPTCTMADQCSCTFVKFKDRRNGDRRTYGFDERRLWYKVEERRQKRGRRKSDR